MSGEYLMGMRWELYWAGGPGIVISTITLKQKVKSLTILDNQAVSYV